MRDETSSNGYSLASKAKERMSFPTSISSENELPAIAIGLGIIVVVLLLLAAWIAVTALITTLVNIWAVGQGGLYFVWGINIAMSLVWLVITFGIRGIGALLG